jgi:hypothetical protein
MNDETADPIHWSFWLIGAVALIWNVMGCINFFMQMDADVVASFSESARALVEERPGWATAAFAISQFGGAIGCILLLLRRSAAYHAFIASLLGIVVIAIRTLGMAASTIDLAPGEIAGYIVMPLGVAVFLIWYSKHAERKSWIR